jgi:hypothetical protein
VLLLTTGVLQRLFHLAHAGRHPRLDRAQRHPDQGGHLPLGVAAEVGEQQGLALGGRQPGQGRADLGPALGRLDLVLDPGLGVGRQLQPSSEVRQRRRFSSRRTTSTARWWVIDSR